MLVGREKEQMVKCSCVHTVVEEPNWKRGFGAIPSFTGTTKRVRSADVYEKTGKPPSRESDVTGRGRRGSCGHMNKNTQSNKAVVPFRLWHTALAAEAVCHGERMRERECYRRGGVSLVYRAKLFSRDSGTESESERS